MLHVPLEKHGFPTDPGEMLALPHPVIAAASRTKVNPTALPGEVKVIEMRAIITNGRADL